MLLGSAPSHGRSEHNTENSISSVPWGEPYELWPNYYVPILHSPASLYSVQLYIIYTRFKVVNKVLKRARLQPLTVIHTYIHTHVREYPHLIPTRLDLSFTWCWYLRQLWYTGSIRVTLSAPTSLANLFPSQNVLHFFFTWFLSILWIPSVCLLDTAPLEKHVHPWPR